MHCRDIPYDLFKMIAADLANPEHQDGDIETVTGYHPSYGLTILVRDATRCMALVVDASVLDQLISRLH